MINLLEKEEIGNYFIKLPFYISFICSQKMVSISEATQSMSAFTQLTDGILNLIKSLVDDPEVNHYMYQ